MDEEIKALKRVIGQFPECFYTDENDLAKKIIRAGYRLDPFPNGKTKQELLEIIQKKDDEIEHLKVVLRSTKEHLQELEALEKSK